MRPGGVACCGAPAGPSSSGATERPPWSPFGQTRARHARGRASGRGVGAPGGTGGGGGRRLDNRASPAAQSRGGAGRHQRLGAYDWVVFTSANGVRWSWDALVASGRDAGAFAGRRLAAVGPATAAALAERGLSADVVPTELRGEGLADEMLRAIRGGVGPASPARVLVLRALEAREVLPAACGPRAAPSTSSPSTRRAPSPAPARSFARRCRADASTPSPSRRAAPSTTSATPGARRRALARPLCVVSIGPVTTRSAEARGVRVDATAEPSTLRGLVGALAAALAARAPPKNDIPFAWQDPDKSTRERGNPTRSGPLMSLSSSSSSARSRRCARSKRRCRGKSSRGRPRHEPARGRAAARRPARAARRGGGGPARGRDRRAPGARPSRARPGPRGARPPARRHAARSGRQSPRPRGGRAVAGGRSRRAGVRARHAHRAADRARRADPPGDRRLVRLAARAPHAAPRGAAGRRGDGPGVAAAAAAHVTEFPAVPRPPACRLRRTRRSLRPSSPPHLQMSGWRRSRRRWTSLPR